MKVSYDEDLDIAYIRFSHKKPDGAIEIGEGVVLDTTAKNEIVGIEIFDAKEKFPLKSLYQFEVSPAHSATRVGSHSRLHTAGKMA